MLTGMSAAVLFSFNRIYNILSSVKQIIGAVVANFLGEFFGIVGCQVEGIISLVGLLVVTILKFGKPVTRECNEQ